MGLGPGYHYGEWWGQGIQRKYGLTEKRWSLFNTSRWELERPTCCYCVPVLYRGVFESSAVYEELGDLLAGGSIAAPGFMNPEGVVIYHIAAGQYFKKTILKDDEPKGAQR